MSYPASSPPTYEYFTNSEAPTFYYVINNLFLKTGSEMTSDSKRRAHPKGGCRIAALPRNRNKKTHFCRHDATKFERDLPFSRNQPQTTILQILTIK